MIEIYRRLGLNYKIFFNYLCKNKDILKKFKDIFKRQKRKLQILMSLGYVFVVAYIINICESHMKFIEYN